LFIFVGGQAVGRRGARRRGKGKRRSDYKYQLEPEAFKTHRRYAEGHEILIKSQL
jgi:hypothetical protein